MKLVVSGGKNGIHFVDGIDWLVVDDFINFFYLNIYRYMVKIIMII